MAKWYIRLVAMVLAALSAPLREEIIAFATAFRDKAKETPNPWDDFAADVICWLLGIP